MVAHAGAPESDEFLHLAETHEHVALDTTMAFTPFFEQMGGAYPTGLLPRLRAVCWTNTAALLDQTGEKFPVLHS